MNNTLGHIFWPYSLERQELLQNRSCQHWCFTATVCCADGSEMPHLYERLMSNGQAPNVRRIKLLGAEVVSVETGSQTLKDAINAALRDWVSNLSDTHYLLGTAAGPHPFPMIVRDFQHIIGKEARRQFQEHLGCFPDAVVACVGGGSNAVGIFSGFQDLSQVRLIGVEPAGKGLHTNEHAATLCCGTPRILHETLISPQIRMGRLLMFISVQPTGLSWGRTEHSA